MNSRPLLLLPVLLIASCAKDDDSAAANPGFKPLSQRIDERSGFTQDAEGNWMPQTNRRSSLETNRNSPYFQGEYRGKTYEAGEYAKKSWWGKEQIAPPSYSGNTDGSSFATTSRLQGQGANEGSGGGYRTGGYSTDNYGTGSARETGGRRLAKPGNALVERRNETFTPPAIMDYQQERALSVGQTKSLTGR